MLSGGMQSCLALPQATVRTSARLLLRPCWPVAQTRGRYQHVQARAFTSLAPTKLPSLLTPDKLMRSSRRSTQLCSAKSDTAIDEVDTPKIVTEFITQALFNYFSCSAVAIATIVGGSSSSMVTWLTIAAHMVLVPLIAYVGAPASGLTSTPLSPSPS